MKTSSFIKFLLVFCTAVLVQASAGDEVNRALAQSILVLPTEDFAETPVIADALTPLVKSHLISKGFLPYSDDSLRLALRQLRIRNSFELTREDIRKLRQHTGVELALISSLDNYKSNSGGAEVSVSARLLSMPDVEILWSATESRHSRDGNFRLPGYRHDAVEAQMRHVLSELFEDFRTIGLRYKRTVRSEKLMQQDDYLGHGIAILLPGNETTDRFATHRIANQLVAEFVRRGYRVIDPGVVRGEMIATARLARGEVSKKLLSELQAGTGAHWVLTGTLRQYRDWIAAESDMDCELALDIRLIDTESANVIWSASKYARGSEQTGLFGTGYIHGLSVLSEKLIAKMIATIPSKKTRIAHR